MLLFSLARAGVEFESALVRKIVFQDDGAVVSADVAGEPREYRCQIVLGCDGANSVVARAAGLRTRACSKRIRDRHDGGDALRGAEPP